MKKNESLFFDLLSGNFFLPVLKLFILIMIISPGTANAQASLFKSSLSQDLSFPEIVSSEVISPQQPLREIRGTVKDEQGQPLIGASIVVKGTTTGAITDVGGNFILLIPATGQTLVISYVGMISQEIQVGDRTEFNIVLEEETIGLDEVVVIGYGTQKRESIIGAITNTTNEALEKRGGVVNLASALSGQLPSVIVLERTGEPGREDPFILIRGQSTWNDATPLILVDGIERRMNDINVNEVESVSVLKDASATAVFGVKGANGVILITTKRGQLGKAQLSMSANIGIKDISKTFGVVEAVTAKLWKNEGIEHEVSAYETTWANYLPYQEVMKFKTPQEYPDLYPNVNWPDVVLKPFATNKQVNMNVSGGTQFARYFAAIAYTSEGDLLESRANDKGYDPEYAYNRMNFRGNLDFELSKTTKLSTNVSGYAATKKETMAYANNWIFQSIYVLPPDAFPVRYSDGVYGKDPENQNLHNPLAILNEAGLKRTHRLFIGTDFKLQQDLDIITKGLSAVASLSFDNTFTSAGPNITDRGNQGQTLYKFVSPDILEAKTLADTLNATIWMPSVGGTAVNEYDFVLLPWTINNPTADNNLLARALFYQLSLNYGRTFNKHDVTALALFNRRQTATGASFPGYREDWVGRTTYAFDNRYFAEFNAAYNGSEKFGPGYRFGFFPSFAVGWMVSNESFLQQFDWLYKLKLRASYGKVGSDSGIPRWGYIGSWTMNQYGFFGNTAGQINPRSAMQSPYSFYWEGTIPNVDLTWETALKQNFGIEISVLENMLTFEADIFKDRREDIFLSAGDRNIPAYFGAAAVPINYGETETKGIEIDLMFRKRTETGWQYWIRQSMTRAKDIILRAEDPELQDAHLKTAGFQIGQTKTQIRDGSIANSWDDVYAQTTVDNPIRKLPGDWGLIDFNGDGVMNSFDNMPYAYPNNRPGNTYSTFLGFGYKNFNCMVQFYGVTNITQNVSHATPEVARRTRVSEYLLDYWTKYDPNSTFMAPRLGTGSGWGEFTRFDGSYLRLKTAEVSYDLPTGLTNRIGISNAKLYLNGNNLFFWSDLPMDVESGNWDVYNSYPTYRIFNMGIELVF